MAERVTRAILRTPGRSFAAGLTVAGGGAPDLSLALAQHEAYAKALGGCGLALTVLPANERFPDGTFVEDTAVLTPRAAIVTRPGAPSRLGEIDSIAETLRGVYPTVLHIEPPGTVDGGDVCECDGRFLIGVSSRTDAVGAEQLAGFLRDLGYRATLIDIRGSQTLLHLKTGLSYLGDGRLVVSSDVPQSANLMDFERIALEPSEAYAANCIRVNDRVLVAAGYPRFAERLARLGLDPLPLGMSEFRKMDGGLSCLSLRF
ncbi:MAG TPA: arginine deiminase family protein [Steroidobacteraceae bacterium]|nr:arginine deiminase family protein [Steroidobacteraceae bacterium]